jgi:hypothetical protein
MGVRRFLRAFFGWHEPPEETPPMMLSLAFASSRDDVACVNAYLSLPYIRSGQWDMVGQLLNHGQPIAVVFIRKQKGEHYAQ